MAEIAAAGPLNFSQEQRRTLAWLRAGLVFGIVLPVVVFAMFAWLHYREVLDETRIATARTAHILSEHALKLFDTSAVLLERLDAMVTGQARGEIRADAAALHQQAVRLVANLPQVQSVWVLDAQGRVLLTNRDMPTAQLNFSDRESFIVHKDGYKGVYVTGTVKGKATGDVFFDVSRARRDPAGRFLGTVKVNLSPAYLQAFYREIAVSEDDMTLAMLSTDGSLIARWPRGGKPGIRMPLSPAVARDLDAGRTSGTYELVSPLDRQARVLSFRKVGNYPVLVASSVRRNAILMGFAYDMLWPAVLTILACVALGVAGAFAIRKTRRELDMANRLYEEGQQRKQVEHALLHAQKMEALGHLTGGVAHDFNNLLMVIGMNAHLLKSTVAGLAGNPRLEAIQRSVGNGAKLTRQLLSFSRRQPLVLATIDLQAELKGIVDLCAPVLGKGVSTKVEVAPDTPALTIDRAELELSLINLAINARRAMPDGGRFEVTARALPDGWLEIAASDTGCGIPADVLPRVTEPFFSTRPSGEGTGLGLSQVNTMCQRAGGALRIDSEVGKGTTVRLRFPAAARRTDSVGPEAQVERGRALRLLLVEDNPEIASATQFALESLGCTVQRCVNADEALAWLDAAARLPDAVLSDISMPGTMDGIALARDLRERYPDLPVALMTGYAERLADAEALHLRVLPKPFDVNALRQLVAQLARGQALPR